MRHNNENPVPEQQLAPCGLIPIYIIGGPCALPRGHDGDHQTKSGKQFTRGNWPKRSEHGLGPSESDTQETDQGEHHGARTELRRVGVHAGDQGRRRSTERGADHPSGGVDAGIHAERSEGATGAGGRRGGGPLGSDQGSHVGREERFAPLEERDAAAAAAGLCGCACHHDEGEPRYEPCCSVCKQPEGRFSDPVRFKCAACGSFRMHGVHDDLPDHEAGCREDGLQTTTKGATMEAEMQSRHRLRIAEQAYRDGERAERARVVAYLRDKETDEDTALDMLTRMYANGIEGGEHHE